MRKRKKKFLEEFWRSFQFASKHHHYLPASLNSSSSILFLFSLAAQFPSVFLSFLLKIDRETSCENKGGMWLLLLLLVGGVSGFSFHIDTFYIFSLYLLWNENYAFISIYEFHIQYLLEDISFEMMKRCFKGRFIDLWKLSLEKGKFIFVSKWKFEYFENIWFNFFWGCKAWIKKSFLLKFKFKNKI